MDDQLVWRDWRDPMNRVYPLFADEHGRVHPKVRERVGEVLAEMKLRDTIKKIADDPRDPRLSPRSRNDWTRLWSLVGQDATGEMKRLVLGLPAENPRVKTGRMRPEHLRWHEGAIVDQWGLFLAELPADTSPERWMSFSNGRVLGFYLGGVLPDGEAEDIWKERYPQYPHYAMDVQKPGGGYLVMSAEGAANSTGFGNTALEPPAVDKYGRPVQAG
jgi:hypothetical protein